MGANSLAEKVLLAPTLSGADHLYILTKNATPNMVSWLLINLPKKQKVPVDLIINTAETNGIRVDWHESFKELHSQVASFICSYIDTPISAVANLYIWLKNDSPFIAFSGSADFEQGAFLDGTNDNINECDAQEALDQYRIAENDSIYCYHHEVEEHIKIFQASGASTLNEAARVPFDTQGEEVVLPLVTSKTGEPGVHSGLNWGQRKRRNPNQAYIPLPSKIAKSGFFPVEPADSPPHFTVVTDDNHQLILRIEQQNHKAIATPLSNAQLGEYFRNRLNLANGAYVKRADLERYGRTDVKFVKIDDEHYYMDFSI
jgi:hypothetical protein